jgi:MBOAT, membrane-bound O-acyltransferase family
MADSMLLLAGIFAPYVIACAVFPLLSARAAWPLTTATTAAIASVAIASCPWLIPSELSLLRFLASLSAALVALKLFDVSIELRQGRHLGWRDFVMFLGHPFTLVRRKLAQEPRPAQRENLLNLARSAAGCALCMVLLSGLFELDWSQVHFWVEHSTKVLVFMLAIVFGLNAGAALWRLAGGTARDYMDRPLIARTPAQFWRRYNRNVQQFFWHDVFSGHASRRAPIRTMLFVFALSALLHEFIFFAAIGRVQGYQTAFFAVQGLAAALTARIKVRGWLVLPWVVGTLVFNLASSVLFFASIHGVMPFYSRGLPPWLQGW